MLSWIDNREKEIPLHLNIGIPWNKLYTFIYQNFNINSNDNFITIGKDKDDSNFKQNKNKQVIWQILKEQFISRSQQNTQKKF